MRPTPKGLLTAGATALGVAAVLVLNPTQDGTSVATTVTDGAEVADEAEARPPPERRR